MLLGESSRFGPAHPTMPAFLSQEDIVSYSLRHRTTYFLRRKSGKFALQIPQRERRLPKAHPDTTGVRVLTRPERDCGGWRGRVAARRIEPSTGSLEALPYKGPCNFFLPCKTYLTNL